ILSRLADAKRKATRRRASIFVLRVLKHGGNGVIRGSRQTAGGHRPRHRRLCPSEEERSEFHRPLPFSRREDSILRRASGQADLSLFWLRQGRGRFHFRDGNGEMPVSRGGPHRGGKVRHRLCPERRRHPSPSSETKVCREAAGGVGPAFPGPGRPPVRSLPPAYHVSHRERVRQDRRIWLPGAWG